MAQDPLEEEASNKWLKYKNSGMPGVLFLSLRLIKTPDISEILFYLYSMINAVLTWLSIHKV